MADPRPTTPEPAARGQSRPAVITAALIYLIAAYQRTPCPCVALCIVRHLDCLADHQAADPVIRQICGAVRATWARAAEGAQPARAESTKPERLSGQALLH
jgi:hypothetical protein